MGNTGLGLAIVKHIISRHRGRLLITSKEGKGSSFSVTLPIWQDRSDLSVLRSLRLKQPELSK